MLSSYRLTPARKALLEIFSTTSKPLSALEISSLMFNNSVKVNKTTVYRELNFLINNKFINELYISNGKKYYESANLKHHHHVVCTDCGTIEDVKIKNDMGREEKRLERETGFKVFNHSLEFFGLCTDCN